MDDEQLRMLRQDFLKIREVSEKFMLESTDMPEVLGEADAERLGLEAMEIMVVCYTIMAQNPPLARTVQDLAMMDRIVEILNFQERN
jgi:hypothetical protein